MFAGGLGGGENTAAATKGWGCIFWRVPRNTTAHQLSPADDNEKVGDTVVQLTDDDSGGPDDNNNGEPEDGQQREDSGLRSPSYFQPQQPKQ